MVKADLHIHSNCSDGSESPKELIETIKNSQIIIFALTDHDTVEGYAELYKYLPKEIKCIPSVELTCKLEQIECHILGYYCDINNKNLLNLIEKGKKLRRIKLETRIKFLKEKWNIDLTKEELNWLYSRKSVVKTHLANILVNRKLALDNVSAMKKYLDNCKCPNTKFDGKEAINIIVESGGIPVWAHPLGGEGEKHISQDIFINQLRVMKQHGIKGVECYYSRYNNEEIDFLTEQANLNHLVITGGSDYHGTNKSVKIGELNNQNMYIDSKKLTILS